MNLTKVTLCFLLFSAPLMAEEEKQQKVYQKILETKYQASLERLRILDFSDTTKVLGFDFEMSGDKSWWGGFNVIETDREGTPLFWYDIPQPPTEAGIERIRMVQLSGRKYLEIIGCSHKGNGSLYLYELRNGSIQLLVNCRVMTNLSAMHFSPTIAKINYRDVDGDGDQDLVITANCHKGQIIGKSRHIIGKYRRVYHYDNGEFIEQVEKRDGAPMLMD